MAFLIVVPYIPTGFTTTAQYHRHRETTVTIEWNPPPRNSSPAAVVDSYIISFLPAPISHSTKNVLLALLFNVSLAHNTFYDINVTAVNCAGESQALVSSGLRISKSKSLFSNIL